MMIRRIDKDGNEIDDVKSVVFVKASTRNSQILIRKMHSKWNHLLVI